VGAVRDCEGFPIDKHEKGASETTRPLDQAGSFITGDFIGEPACCRPRVPWMIAGAHPVFKVESKCKR
jgi:hypothetical protein